MHTKELFEANLSLVERVISRVCLKAHLSGADAEDFGSTARLHLMENDYHVLRLHDPDSSLPAYLAVVLQRHLSDQRNRDLGRWRPSAEARRMGDTGVLLETLLLRDQRPLREVVPIVAAAGRLPPRDVEAMAARLPERSPRTRTAEIDEVMEATLAAEGDTASRVVERERRQLAEKTGNVLGTAIAALPLEDRMIVKLRFGSAMSIADIARILRLPQRPLYRRIESMLAGLRRALTNAGIDGAAALELIGCMTTNLDLGLTETGGQS